MAFLYAVHHFEIGGIELVHRPTPPSTVWLHAGGAVDGEAHLHQAVDDRLDLRLCGASCITTNMDIYDPFELSRRFYRLRDSTSTSAFRSSIFSFCTLRISSMMRSKMRFTASAGSGPWLWCSTFAKTWSSRFGS